MRVLEWIVSGGFVPILLMASGLFFLLYLRGRPFRHPIRMLRAMAQPSETEGISPFRAVMLALAGTLGVGNIVGVANAVWIGGAGAVFWMWISALVAAVLKYAEILLAILHRRSGRVGYFGGAYYYIKDHFESRRHARLAVGVSCVFAGFVVVNALGMGCIVQVNAVSSALRGVLSVPAWVSGLLLAALTLPVILRGVRGISALTELLVPIMTLGYLILSVAVLLIKRDAVGEAFASIFREAFSAESMGGGVIGFVTSRALRTGTMRGLLSNEAGCGTAPTAHAAAHTHSAAAQGIWGIFEVFVDTILLCTATALVILVSLPEVEMLGEDAVMMTIRAYSTVLGGWAEWFFCAAILCFGYATVLCWAGYGLEGLSFLSPKKRWRALYFLSFGGCILIGALSVPASIWGIADFCIAGLVGINLWTLLLMRREIRTETLLWANK